MEQKQNMKSGLMLGVNPLAERQKEDYYATDPNALIIFLRKLNKEGVILNENIWECAELQVLQGAIKTIKENKPIVFLEILKDKREIIDFMDELGYGYQIMGGDNYLFKLGE